MRIFAWSFLKDETSKLPLEFFLAAIKKTFDLA